jgi:hypothetical protein
VVAVWYSFGAEVRSRWRSLVALSVLLGLAGGVALAAAAGARRTSSASSRYRRSSRASDVTVDLPPDLSGHTPDEIAGELPGVRDHSISSGMTALLGNPDGTPDFGGADQVVASVDGRFFTSDRLAVTRGRLPMPDRADEAAVNEAMARSRHILPGDRITLLRETTAQAQATGDGPPGELSPVVLRVTGIVVASSEIVQDDVGRQNVVTLTPAYFAEHTADASFLRLGLRLRGGHRGVPAVQLATQRLLSNPDDPSHTGPQVEDEGQIASRAQNAIRPLVLALALFAALAGAVALLVIGQGLSRHIRSAAAENPVRRALGADRAQLFLLSVLSGSVVAIGGAVVAVAAALALSPLFPLAPVRAVEPHRGVSVDITALGIGAVVLLVLVVAQAAMTAWGTSRPHVEHSPGSLGRTDRAIAGLPPSIAVGARLALDPRRGKAALGLRATVAGSAVALAAVVVSVSFGANLAHLQRTPAQYGWGWDLGFLSSGGYGTFSADDLRPLDNDPAVAAYATIAFDDVSVDGEATSALGFAQGRGTLLPPVIAGRAFGPGSDEVVLGSSILRRLHKSVGDEVTVALAAATIRARIVGRAVLPAFGRVDTRRSGLGEGVAMSAPTLARLSQGDHPNALIVRLATSGARAGGISRLRDAFGDPAQFKRSYGPQKPAELVNGAQASDTQFLVGLLGLAAAATLAHTLVSAIRQRRRDLAVLKTLGFDRRQVRTAVSSLATTLLVGALVVGIPIGMVAGQWSWRLFADQLGVLPTTVIPQLVIAAIVPVTLVLTNLVASGPAWAAARTNPATELRSE